MRNKFIFFGIDTDLNDALFGDLFDDKRVTYIKDVRYQFKGITNFLYRLHHSAFLNSIMKLPFKCIWNRFYIKENLEAYDQVYFVFFYYHFFLFENRYSNYIKNNYPNAKQIVYFDDIHVMRNRLSELKTKYGFIDAYYVFNDVEAKKEKIDFFPLPYSKGNVATKKETITSDVCFVGYGKNRYQDIIKIFEKLDANGVNCDFHIIGVEPSEQMYNDKIHYDKPLPYKTAIQILSKSKCGLELQLADCESYSQRVYETLINNKKLLTNNKHIKNFSYYNSNYISVFSSVDDIDIDFLKENIDIDYRYGGEFSPIHFLDELEGKFKKGE